MNIQNLQSLIRSVPDYPKKGILFRDITPLLAAPEGLILTAKLMAEKIKKLDLQPTIIAGPESRGFIFGVALAQYLSLGFVPIRKKGKLPRETYQAEYSLEYGTDVLEIHQDAVTENDHVLLVDDLLATGGTVSACVELLERSGARVEGALFLIELLGLDGRSKIQNYIKNDIKIGALIQYD